MIQHLQFFFQVSATNIVTDFIYLSTQSSYHRFVTRAGRIVDLCSGSSNIHIYSDL